MKKLLMFLLFVSVCCGNVCAQDFIGKWGRMKAIDTSDGLGHGDEIVEFKSKNKFVMTYTMQVSQDLGGFSMEGNAKISVNGTWEQQDKVVKFKLDKKKKSFNYSYNLRGLSGEEAQMVKTSIESNDSYQNMLSDVEMLLMDMIDELCSNADENGGNPIIIESIEKKQATFTMPNGETAVFRKR